MGVFAKVGEEHGHVGVLQRLALPHTAGIGQRGFHHALHFVKGSRNTGLGLGIVHHFRPDAQSRQRRSKVMGERGQHLGPIRHKPRKARLHVVEGQRQVSHLGRPVGCKWPLSPAAAELVCRAGEFVQRARQAGQEEPEDRKEQHSRRQDDRKRGRERPLDRRSFEPCRDVQPAPIRDFDRNLHLNRCERAFHHLGVHFGHFGRQVWHGKKPLLDFVHLDPNVPAVTIVQKRTNARLDGAVCVVMGMRHRRSIPEFEAHQRRVGRGNNVVVQISRGPFNQPGHVRCTPRCFDPNGGLHGQRAFIHK